MVRTGQSILATLVIGGGVTLGVYSPFNHDKNNLLTNSGSESSTSEEKAQLSNQDHSSTSFLTSSTSSERSFSQNPKQINAKANNCQIIQDLKNILPPTKRQEDYYSISCKNKGINTKQDENFLDHWKGLFPKKLFKNNNQLTTRKKLEIKIESDMKKELQNNWYKVTLSSKQFKNNRLTGKWSYKAFNSKWGALIKLDSQISEEIYLLLQE